MKYIPTIGLEIHAELKTRTKMFCDSKNDPDETRPNINICPVCMAHPGTLPVINKQAVKHVLTIGVAVGGEIADFTEFDRKNYFYPDIPKGYQISQYKYPLVRGGELRGVSITRIHLEEDTARSIHLPAQAGGEGKSLIDFNRAGIPLMELVTEPVIHSAGDASSFAKELQLLLRSLDASDADMEKGQMRAEANISLSKDKKLGTKVEVKNLNSFRSVERAIDFEVQRQTAVLKEGRKVAQETRGWDEVKQATFSQRLKESSHDYRYFPDPDLPKLHISRIPEFSVGTIRDSLPELPWEKRARYQTHGLKTEDADLFVSDPVLGFLFDDAWESLKGESDAVKLAANYIGNDIAALRASKEKGSLSHVTGAEIAELVKLLQARKIGSRNAKDIIASMYRDGGTVREISESRGFLMDESIDLQKIAKEIIEANQDVAAEYRGGKENALQYLVGQGMRMTKGTVDPSDLCEALRAEARK